MTILKQITNLQQPYHSKLEKMFPYLQIKRGSSNVKAIMIFHIVWLSQCNTLALVQISFTYYMIVFTLSLRAQYNRMGGQATTSTGPLQTCTRSRFTGICFWGWEKIDVRLRCVGTHGKGWSKNSDAIFSLFLPMSHLAYLNLTPIFSHPKNM